MPYKRPTKGKSKDLKNIPSSSIARHDTPTKGSSPKCRTVVGMNDVDFELTEDDLFTIKFEVALYRLGKMLKHEREADEVIKKRLTEYVEEQDKFDFRGRMNCREHQTVLIQRMIDAAVSRVNMKGAHYNIMRHDLKSVDDAFQRKDSNKLFSIMAQYDEWTQENLKSETENRSMDFTLVNMYISKVLIPNDWMFRSVPDVAAFEAFHPNRQLPSVVQATAQLAQIIKGLEAEDDERSHSPPVIHTTAQLAQILEELEVEGDDRSETSRTAQLTHVIEDKDDDKERARNFSRLEKGKYRKIDYDDDGTITETENDRRRLEVAKAGPQIGSDDDGTVTETDDSKRKQEVRRIKSNHPTLPTEGKSGRTNGMAKRWR